MDPSPQPEFDPVNCLCVFAALCVLAAVVWLLLERRLLDWMFR